MCGGDHDHERVRCLHPPIDALLLMALVKENFDCRRRPGASSVTKRWSKFDSDTYQDVIDSDSSYATSWRTYVEN